jgi:membrane protein
VRRRGDTVHPAWYVVRRTAWAFHDDRVLDIAAGLTFYGVLAVGPAVIALVSVLSLLGQSPDVVDRVLDAAAELGPDAAVETAQRILDALPSPPSAGAGLVLGLLGALWSASAYVTAFGRAMNKVHDVEEGRPFWRFRPLMFVVTLLVLALLAVIAVALVAAGPVTRFLSEVLESGSAAAEVWQAARWPVVLLLIIVVVAVLYHVTPNVRAERFRLLSVGSTVAILGWVLASMGFNAYVTRFGRYDAIYGSLAGLVVALLWLWLANIALLAGAELDAEVERVRQLRAGLAAEERLQLPPRDATTSARRAARIAQDVADGRAIRERALVAAGAGSAGDDATGEPSRGGGPGRGSS